jgi:hypothetical protein
VRRSQLPSIGALAVAAVLALPSASHAANSPFLVPLVIEAAQAVQTPVGLHQVARLSRGARLVEDVALPDGPPLKAGELLIGGTVGQGLMYCASPQSPKEQLLGQNRPGFTAVCFRDSTNSGVFDLMASQYQRPDRADTVIEAGFSDKMDWKPVHVAYKALAPDDGPEIILEVKGVAEHSLIGGDRVFIYHSVCFPPGMHHNAKRPDDSFCGLAQFDRRFYIDPNGTTLGLAKGGPAKRFTNGPVEVDFSMTGDGAVVAQSVHALPEGPAMLAIAGQITRGYAGVQATIFLVQPISNAAVSP